MTAVIRRRALLRHDLTRSCAAIVLLAAALAACSSSKAASSSSTDDSTGAASPTGSPVTIMAIASENNPAFAEKQQFQAAQARVDSINAMGGLNGHPVKLITCDSNLDPNQEAACVAQAVSKKVSAVVSSTLLFTSFASLEQAKIPVLANQAAAGAYFTSADSYPFAGILAWFLGQVAMAKQDGVKSVGFASLNTEAAKFADQFVIDGLKKAGIELKTTVHSDVTQTDFTADAAAVVHGNPDGVITDGTAASLTKLIIALRTGGYKGKIYALSSALDSSTLKAMGAEGEGVRVASVAMPVTSTSDTEVSRFLADMAKYAPSAKIDELAETGWSSVDVFATIMKTATSFTGANVIAALSRLTKPVTAGVMGPFIGSGPPIVAKYPRTLNGNFVPAVVKNGAIVATGGFTSTASYGG